MEIAADQLFIQCGVHVLSYKVCLSLILMTISADLQFEVYFQL